MSPIALIEQDALGGLIRTDLPWPRYSGKVRDVYDLGDRLLIIATDRISAFDWILPTAIPEKGKILTALSNFWFDRLNVAHHRLSSELPTELDDLGISLEPLRGRTMVVRKARVVPFECVVRGYLEGSGWKDYQQNQQVCGVSLMAGMRQCEQLAEPIFTPATKAVEGHDENVSFETMASSIGDDLAAQLRQKSLQVYQEAATYARQHGIIIADTKFEWALCEDQLILVDEVLTPDSSRFWPADDYQPGRAQRSFDKQFVREWLAATDWDRNSPPPPLPEEVIFKTREKYLDALTRLTGTSRI